MLQFTTENPLKMWGFFTWVKCPVPSAPENRAGFPLHYTQFQTFGRFMDVALGSTICLPLKFYFDAMFLHLTHNGENQYKIKN